MRKSCVGSGRTVRNKVCVPIALAFLVSVLAACAGTMSGTGDRANPVPRLTMLGRSGKRRRRPVPISSPDKRRRSGCQSMHWSYSSATGVSGTAGVRPLFSGVRFICFSRKINLTPYSTPFSQTYYWRFSISFWKSSRLSIICRLDLSPFTLSRARMMPIAPNTTHEV